MKLISRKLRVALRRGLILASSFFERPGSKGNWFERQYYTQLFTRNRHYSRPEPNAEELARWQHIRSLLTRALVTTRNERFSFILDFGCGRGWLARKLEAYGQVMGIEPIARVVEHGRRIYPGLDLRVGNINSLDELTPDLVICSEVLEHLDAEEQQVLFCKFFAILQPGGHLIITTPRKEAYEAWSGFVELEQPAENWLSGAELSQLGVAAGFSVVQDLTYGASPAEDAPLIEVYQQWLFRKST